MIDCPNCNNQFDADFGMVSCPSCQQILIVDIDGNVQVDDANDSGGLAETRVATSMERQVDTTAEQGVSSSASSQQVAETMYEPAQSLLDDNLNELNEEIPYESEAEEKSFANYQPPDEAALAATEYQASATTANPGLAETEMHEPGDAVGDETMHVMNDFSGSSEDWAGGENSISHTVDSVAETIVVPEKQSSQADNSHQLAETEMVSQSYGEAPVDQSNEDSEPHPYDDIDHSATQEEVEEEVVEEGQWQEPEMVTSDLEPDEQQWLEDSGANSLANENSETSEEDFSDVEDYGNSEMSLAREGPYVYDLRISNVDSASIRQELKDILEDRKFAWNANKLMAEIKNGVLVLEQLNPIKASIIVNRIKGTSLRVQWKQNAVTQMDV